MPLVGVYALTALGVLLALLAPLEIAFGAVLGAWMLVPAGLILPGGLHVFLVDRLVLAAFALRLFLRRHQPGEPGPEAYRPTVLHLAWGALLLVGFVDGVLLPPVSMHDSLVLWWLTWADCGALLVVSLAVLRTLGMWRVLRPLGVVVAGAVGIGVIERITGHGWAAYLSDHIPNQYLSTFVFGLGSRGGAVRVQAASEFALEYGWVLAILLPLLLVAVGVWVARQRDWWRRLILVLLPAAAVADVFMSLSRSAEVAVAVGIVLLVLVAGTSRGMFVGLGAAAVACLAVLALAPSVLLGSFATANPFSAQSRTLRLHILFSLVGHHSFLGLGYTGLHGLNGLDDAYAITYGQLGVVGLLVWLAVLLTSFWAAVRAMRAPRRSQARRLGAATAVGIVAVAAAAAAYDLTFTEQSMWTLVLLGALATYLTEQLPARERRAPSAARLVWPVAGAAAGAAVLALTPLGFSRSFSVYVISPRELATQPVSVYGWTAQELDTTLCGYLKAQPTVPGTTLTCLLPGDVETSVWQAQVTVEVAGPTARAVTAEKRRTLGVFERIGYPMVTPVTAMQSGKPAWAVTAPLSGAFAGAVPALLVPVWRRRRLLPAVAPGHVTPVPAGLAT